MRGVNVLQRLLAAGEYDELEDVVIAEGQFVEVDFAGFATRQVILGMTATNLLVAEQHVIDYKLNPEVYYDTTVDPYLDGLEVSSALPLCVIRLTASCTKYALTVNVQGTERYFEMANTHMNGCLDDVWQRWLERVDYLIHDPYRYIRHMYDTYGLPYPIYYRHAVQDPTQHAVRTGDVVKADRYGRGDTDNNERKKSKQERKMQILHAKSGDIMIEETSSRKDEKESKSNKNALKIKKERRISMKK